MDRLINKAYREYDYVSRYSAFPYYYDTEDDKYIYGTTSYLDDTTAYSMYQVKKNDTYDSLALKFYNTPTLFWVICDFNRIQDPYTLPQEGEYIKIPSLTSIAFRT